MNNDTNRDKETPSLISDEYQERIAAAIAAYHAEQIDAWQEMQAEDRAA